MDVIFFVLSFCAGALVSFLVSQSIVDEIVLDRERATAARIDKMTKP